MRKIKPYLPYAFLLFIEFSLFWLNYAPGTYFLGWDNLFPELNFQENIRRSFFAIWQEYRGLGVLDGMSFAANLPHYIFLSVFSVFLPHDLLRYLFIFLMHLLGGIGTYLLINNLLGKGVNKKLAAVSGGLFYLLNIATVQIFFAPYEVFTVHFAFLPWLLLLTLRFLQSNSRKDLTILGIISFLAIPQAHVPTLFIVYLLSLFTIIGFYLFEAKRDGIKRVLSLVIITLVINAYWLLPYIYSTFHNAEIISNSKINQMSTENIYLRNKAYGNLESVVLLKGFSLDFIDIQNQSDNGYMMASWRKHIQRPLFAIAGLTLFALAFLGLLRAIFKKEKRFYPFVVLFVFSFLMLGNDVPILNLVSNFFYNYMPFFYQIFRFTFTKFAIVYVLAFSILLALGLSTLQLWLKKIRYSGATLMTIFLLTITYHSLPSFQGQFLYGNLKVKIPKEYFELVDYFKKEDKNTRIAIFPQPSFWGWTYNRWGYRGSGFIWYGLPQASLDGAFYPWSRENENYYWEASYAVYSHNLELLEKVFEKYQVRWLILDGNVISPSSSKSLAFEELNNLLSDSSKITLIQTFGKIKIYEVNLKTPVKDFVFLAQNLPRIEPAYKWNNYDRAYLENGNYISVTENTQQATSNTYYPFRSLFTGRRQEELEFVVEDKGDYFLFKKTLPATMRDYYLTIPEVKTEDLAMIDPNNLNFVRYANPEIFFNGEVIEVKIPKINGYLSAKINPFQTKIDNCNASKTGVIKNEIIQQNGESVLQLQALNANNCSASFWLPNLPHKIGYLITAQSRHRSGQPLLFWLENLNSRKADIETYLPAARLPAGQGRQAYQSYFIQPPMEKDGLGYTLHFDNISIGRQPTINDLGEITLNPIPYSFLTELSLGNTSRKSPPQTLELEVVHPTPSLYVARGLGESREAGEVGAKTTLVLSQAYHQGWLAYQSSNSIFPFFGQKINSHVLVNNWANGWVLDPDSSGKIVLVFWPQYLQYLGFGLMGLTLFILFKFLPNQS